MRTHLGQSIRYAIGNCWLGHVLVAAADHGICSIELGDTEQEVRDHLSRRFDGRTLECDQQGLGDDLRSIRAFIDGSSTSPGVALDARGTEYQKHVWEHLAAIPQGRTTTYLEIARHMGDASALRAVAGACAANPLAVVVPCHRVLRADGELGGYRWGIHRKRALLVREGALNMLGFSEMG